MCLSSCTLKIRVKNQELDADENLEEAMVGGLYTSPLSDDDTPKSHRDIEFDGGTVNDSKLSIRLLFKDIYQFIEALENHTINDRRDIVFINNKKNRVIVECKNSCWRRIHTSNVT